MSETIAVFKIAWAQMLVYRLNFILWRVRTLLQFLLVYFIWWTVFQSKEEVFGYTTISILTYILVVTLTRAVVLSSRANDIMNKINDGSIANFLLKPIGLIKYYLAQDGADKLINSLFMIIELSLIIFIFKPIILFQKNIEYIILFFVALVLGVILWFCINMIIGLMSFWVENSWGPLFLIIIFIEGFGGGIFPLDVLPKSMFSILMLTPFPYLVYFPAKLYLGGFNPSQLIFYFSIFTAWVIICFLLMQWMLNKGLSKYTSVGG